jgi:hypothetical protein
MTVVGREQIPDHCRTVVRYRRVSPIAERRGYRRLAEPLADACPTHSSGDEDYSSCPKAARDGWTPSANAIGIGTVSIP